MRKNAISSVLRLSLYALPLTVACFVSDGSRAQAPVDPPQDGSILNEMSGSGNPAETTKKPVPLEKHHPTHVEELLYEPDKAFKRAWDALDYYRGLGEDGREYYDKYAERLLETIDITIEMQTNHIEKNFKPPYEGAKNVLDWWENYCVERQEESQLWYAVKFSDKAEEVLKALKSRDRAKESYEDRKKRLEEQEHMLQRVKNTKDVFSRKIEWDRYRLLQGGSRKPTGDVDAGTPESPTEQPADLGGLPPVGFQVMPAPANDPGGTGNYAALSGHRPVSSGPEQESSTDDGGSIMNEFAEAGIVRLTAPKEAKVTATDRVAGASAVGASGPGCD